MANFGRAKSQGASTISSMQVARNVYLSAEKHTHKIYEILLTFKLEHTLTKEQFLRFT